jgi:hypothetical protein
MGRSGEAALAERWLNLLTLGLAPLPALLILGLAMWHGLHNSPQPLAWFSPPHAAATFWPDEAEDDLSAWADDLPCPE